MLNLSSSQGPLCHWSAPEEGVRTLPAFGHRMSDCYTNAASDLVREFPGRDWLVSADGGEP